MTSKKNLFSGILLAAGSGQRFNSDTTQEFWPKQFWEIKSNYSVIEKSFEAIAPFCVDIVMTIPSLEIIQSSISSQKSFQAKLEEIIFRIQKSAIKHQCKFSICSGGETRQASVSKALELIDSEYLLIHDGARPLVHIDDLEKLIEKTILHKAAILATPITDTIKQAKELNIIDKTISRNMLWAAQTPQAFETKLFRYALSKANEDNFIGTDDASLMENLGSQSDYCVQLVEATKPNPKITYKSDLDWIRFLG
ncbi:MAG: 2-C-methyl-D-erythritol 4-phosphate cytidylyltransferase [Candidatus Melainabacteria bacterium]|jgi:2-C-methyl-D-erythritol 4-phosphate cytidylyltransferase